MAQHIILTGPDQLTRRRLSKLLERLEVTCHEYDLDELEQDEESIFYCGPMNARDAQALEPLTRDRPGSLVIVSRDDGELLRWVRTLYAHVLLPPLDLARVEEALARTHTPLAIPR